MFEDIKLQDLLEEMIVTDEARGLTVKSVSKNKKLLSVFFAWLDREHSVTTLAGVKTAHIRKFMVFKYNAGVRESYVNSYLRAIRALFTFCENEEYIQPSENPCLRVQWMRESKPVIRAWSDSDIKKMLQYTQKQATEKRRKANNHRGLCSLFVAERNRLMVMTLADTGLRISELENLTDNTFQKDSILVINGKGKKSRVLYCSPLIYKQKLKYDRAKARYFATRKDITQQDFVFLTKAGEKLSTDIAQRFVKQIAKAAGVNEQLRASPHTFRHYFTQKLIENTDVYTVQRLLGHASIKTTETYLNSMENKQVLAAGLKAAPLSNLRK
ncbi:tyrosine-type recombinase/integrase [Enterococcus mediterraneensis]|uniref:tyrosine-type recombinase/integrase n=1 Tax=Enterococcus mediterraneensis TaxID=2364791 RepID=UPI0013DEFBC2|nr:tyrosine-type recombinase/integrase [Enterococcus mediterraneensis]